jgi:hypothetical protein
VIAFVLMIFLTPMCELCEVASLSSTLFAHGVPELASADYAVKAGQRR